jgi:hypothetical protein
MAAAWCKAMSSSCDAFQRKNTNDSSKARLPCLVLSFCACANAQLTPLQLLLQIDAGLIKGQQPPPDAAYVLVLLAVALVAVGDGITQGTVYGDAALLPGKYTQVNAAGASSSSTPTAGHSPAAA